MSHSDEGVNSNEASAEDFNSVCDFCDEPLDINDVKSWWTHECLQLYDPTRDALYVNDKNRVSGVSMTELKNQMDFSAACDSSQSVPPKNGWTLEDELTQTVILNVRSRLALWNFLAAKPKERGRQQIAQHWIDIGAAAGISSDEAKAIWNKVKKDYRTAKSRREKAQEALRHGKEKSRNSHEVVEDFKHFDLLTFLDDVDSQPDKTSQQSTGANSDETCSYDEAKQTKKQRNNKRLKADDHDGSFEERLLAIALGERKTTSNNSYFLGMMDEFLHKIPPELKSKAQIEILDYLRKKVAASKLRRDTEVQCSK